MATAIEMGLPVFMDVRSACKAFSVSDETLYRHSVRGHVRLVKLGRKTLVDVQSLLDHFATHPAKLTRKGAS